MLSQFPRVTLAHLPTPLEHAPRLSEALGGPQIYIKRDDCTGLATGGNKTRKLEFVMADALENKADVVITQGAVQSNHARQTAAAACKLGMACEMIFEHRVTDADDAYLNSGNVFLDRMYGATIHEVEKGTDMDAAMEKRADELRAEGKTPYIISGGASNKIGALGYIDCALETMTQADEQEVDIGHIVHATGSGGTQAGLIVGLQTSGSDIGLLGIGVASPYEEQIDKVWRVAEPTAEYVGSPGCVRREDIKVNTDYTGEGYGLSTPEMEEAVLMLARLEGILFDPVYSGKGLAGMIDLVRKGYFDQSENIVFLHTGGSAGLFGYSSILSL